MMIKYKGPDETVEGGSFTANATAVVSSAFYSPRKETLIETRPYITKTPNHGMGFAIRVPDPNSKKQPIDVTPTFKFILLGVFGFMIICFITYLAIAIIWENPSHNLQTVFDATGFIWKTTAGAFVGLLTGKAT
jgi:hypothetical protein